MNKFLLTFFPLKQSDEFKDLSLSVNEKWHLLRNLFKDFKKGKRIIFLLFFLVLPGCSEPADPSPSIKEVSKEEHNSKPLEKEEEKAKEVVKTTPIPKEVKKIAVVNPTELNKDFSIASDDMLLGDRNSKVIIVEYYSPTCPHCLGYLKRTFPAIKAEYIDTNKIAYVLREFIATKQDLDASILARCRGDVDTFMKFKSVLLQQQENWAYSKNYREILTNIGQLGSVSAEEYSSCLNNEELVKSLLDNTRVAAKVPHFIGTPSFFINGKHFTKPYTFEELSKAIDQALGEGSKVK